MNKITRILIISLLVGIVGVAGARELVVTGGFNSSIVQNNWLALNTVLGTLVNGEAKLSDTLTPTELNLTDGLTATTAELNIVDGATATPAGAELNYVDIGTLGTGAASKAVVPDADDDYTWPATGILTYGVLNDGTNALEATALELNAVADVSARFVTLTGDTSITVAAHEGHVMLLAEDGVNAKASMTLPEATGSGARYHFIVLLANTFEYEIQVATDDIFDGAIKITDGNLADTINAVQDWSNSDSDTINYDSDATCGDVGDWIEVIDIATGVYAADGGCRSDGAAYSTVWAAEQGA